MPRAQHRQGRIQALAAVALIMVAAAACSADDGSKGQPLSTARDVGGAVDTTQATDASTIAPPDQPGAAADTAEEAAESAQETATPTEEPSVLADLAPTESPRDIVVEGSADDLVEPFVQVSTEVLAEPEAPDLDRVVTVADGPAREQLHASIAEFTDNGWTQEGSPEVVSTAVESIDTDGEPPTAVVNVCLDHSTVDIVDSEGVSVVDPNAEMRILTTFTMHFVEGRWVLFNQSFTDDTSC